MSQLSDLKDAVASLTADTQALTDQNTVLLAKVDAFVTLGDNIIERLRQLAEGGQLPPPEMSALTTAINSAREAIHAIGTQQAAESDKVDAATARDQLPQDDAGDGTEDPGTGTPAAGGDAPTEGSGEAPSDGTSVENPPETP